MKIGYRAVILIGGMAASLALAAAMISAQSPGTPTAEPLLRPRKGAVRS